MSKIQPATTFDDPLVARIQEILDRTLASAGPLQASFFGKPERRLHAHAFLSTWNSIYMCAVATTSEGGTAHLAALPVWFEADGTLRMLLYTESVRAGDLATRPRVALQKQQDDGVVLTVYGTTRIVPGTDGTDPRGRNHVVLEIDISRIYALGPYVSGPFAKKTA